MESQNAYHVVGVDGGGTGCRVAICNAAGVRVAEASGGPANFSTDPARAVANVRLAVEQAATVAALDGECLRNCVAHIGLAGILGDADAESVAVALPFRRVRVSDDRETSVLGALGQRDGALVAVGTGSFIAVRQGGSRMFLGGWGLPLGDQASGAWLGKAALRLCLLVHDGIEDGSDLTRELFLRFSNDPAELVGFAGRAQPNDYAALAPLILDAAATGDRNAQSLLRRGSDYLNACLTTAKLRDGDVICLGGGVGPHYRNYLEEGFRSRIEALEGSALDGALQLARQHLSELDISA